MLAMTVCCFCSLRAQTFTHITTTETRAWTTSTTKLAAKAGDAPLLNIDDSAPGHEFLAWGTCFNEMDLDALELLTPAEQEQVMHDLFAPDGDLRFTRGRLTMNANDYSRVRATCSALGFVSPRRV